jgi:hypothetical protein
MVPMTTEMKRAMARYEEARATYQRAVLASLDGRSKGEAIRQAIAEFRAAQRELKRFRPAVPRTAPPVERSEDEEGALLPGLGFFRRLLSPS